MPRLRNRKDKAKWQIGLTLFFASGCLLYKYAYGPATAAKTSYELNAVENENGFVSSEEGRELAVVNNVTCGTFSLEELVDVAGQVSPLCPGSEGFLVLSIFLMVYMFWALAIVVDEKFIPALEYFEDYWNISPDVAGATLMAAGGSAPEFFTNLFSSITLTATGFGTIVGSAVFNILFVIAAVAWFSREVLSLEWWIVFRDSTYYTLTIIVLFFFYLCDGAGDTYSCNSDGVMKPYESGILFALYIIYCVVLFTVHERIRDWIEVHFPRIVPIKQRNPMLHGGGGSIEDAKVEGERRTSLGSRNSMSLRDLRKLEDDGGAIPLRPEGPCPKADEKMNPIMQLLRFFVWVGYLPLGLCLLTVPDMGWESVKKLSRFQKIFVALLEFVLSLIWIGLMTYIMVFSAESFGKTIGIPDVVMGYTFLAAGTSAPDLLSSVFVALKGEGGMAVSSSIGSNIFDITVGLPIPWLISTAIGNTVIIQAKSIVLSLATLIAMLVSVVAVVIHQGWKLTNTLAVAMMVLYFIFLIIVLVPEFV